MADNETTEATDVAEEGEKKKGGLKKIIMIVVPALAVGAGAFFFFFFAGGEDAAAGPTTTAPIVEGDVIELDTLTVNLVGEEGRYARVGMAIVTVEGADTAMVSGKVPLIRDAAISTMTGFTSAELQTQEGMERLRQELSDQAVALFPDGEVTRVVLTELIVQ